MNREAFPKTFLEGYGPIYSEEAANFLATLVSARCRSLRSTEKQVEEMEERWRNAREAAEKIRADARRKEADEQERLKQGFYAVTK